MRVMSLDPRGLNFTRRKMFLTALFGLVKVNLLQTNLVTLLKVGN